MRTTVSLDDDVFRLVKGYAEGRSLALGKVLSELALRGLNAPPNTKKGNGLVVFDLPDNSEVITTEHVGKLEADN